MNHSLPPIYFYIPQSILPLQGIPATIQENWQLFNSGIFMTTLQTYIRLMQSGFPCEFTSTIPDEGIIISHRDCIPFNWRPNRKNMFVCIQSDRLRRHPWAHFYIVHNPREVISNNSYFIPNWSPQPGLIPRDPARGTRVENVAFMGLERNLVAELRDPAWKAALDQLGLNWHIIESDRWNDYSFVDVVVAIRSFDGNEYRDKPAVKLYNSWHAGVPAILGCESAYRAARQSEVDFLEAASFDQAVVALTRLCNEPQLYQAMVSNGAVRAQETAPEVYLGLWQTFLTETVVPAYEAWRHDAGWVYSKFTTYRSVAFTLDRLKYRLPELIKLPQRKATVYP